MTTQINFALVTGDEEVAPEICKSINIMAQMAMYNYTYCGSTMDVVHAVLENKHNTIYQQVVHVVNSQIEEAEILTDAQVTARSYSKEKFVVVLVDFDNDNLREKLSEIFPAGTEFVSLCLAQAINFKKLEQKHEYYLENNLQDRSTLSCIAMCENVSIMRPLYDALQQKPKLGFFQKLLSFFK